MDTDRKRRSTDGSYENPWAKYPDRLPPDLPDLEPFQHPETLDESPPIAYRAKDGKDRQPSAAK